MNIVCFGQQNWDYCWTGKQHLMTRLARRGHRVLYVDPRPLTVPAEPTVDRADTGIARTGPRDVREAEAGVNVLTYRHQSMLGWRWSERRWRTGAVVRDAAAALGFSAPVVLALRPDVGDQMKAVGPAAEAYYAVDEWAGFAGLSDAGRAQMRAMEEALLRRVDLALAVSPRLVERFAQLQPRTHLLPNGADMDHFAPERLASLSAHEALRDLPRPRLGFVGQLDDRLDQDLLLAVAHARPAWQIVLAGRVKGIDVSRLAGTPNVRLIGYQPYDELPRVLREVDVCLVPYRSTILTQSCNPLKVFEYIASGRPVVSTPLEGLFVHGDAVIRAAGADAFVAAIERALLNPEEGRDARLALARANSWDARADRLEELLEDVRQAAARGHAPTRRRAVPTPRPAALTWKARLAFGLLNAAGAMYYGGRVAARRLRGDPEPQIRRILVARHNCDLGDLIALLPTLSALRARFSHAHIVFAAQPGMAGRSLIEGRHVDEVRTLAHLAEPSAVGRLLGTARVFLEGFDLVISGASYYLLREAFFTGAPRRIGLDEGLPLQSLNTEMVPFDPCLHEVDNNLALLELLGISVAPDARAPTLETSALPSEAEFAALAAKIGLNGAGRIVTLHPGSKKVTRRWPGPHVAELAASLLERHQDVQIVFSGVSGERELAEQIRSRIPGGVRRRTHNAAGVTALPELIAIVDRSAVVISNDTGVMHLARARGVPLVALLGPENDRRWGPYRHGPGPVIALRHVVPCAPCRRRACEDLYCLNALPVSEVLEQVQQVLAGSFRGDVYRRSIHRHSWYDLASSGLTVPQVSVMVPVLGAADASPLRGTLASLETGRYPFAEVILAMAPGFSADAVRPAPALRLAPIRMVHASGSDERTMWRAAAQAAQGDWLAYVRPGEAWSGDRLGDAVAQAMGDGDNWTPAVPALDTSRVVRRQRVEAWLRSAEIVAATPPLGSIVGTIEGTPK